MLVLRLGSCGYVGLLAEACLDLRGCFSVFADSRLVCCAVSWFVRDGFARFGWLVGASLWCCGRC